MSAVVSLDNPIAGVLAPLFALRAKNDHGCGDVEALREFVVWAAAQGFRCVQLLPVNETGADNSPYNAISSVALEPSTLAMSEVEDLSVAELSECGVLPGDTGAVQWREVKERKWDLLQQAFANFCVHHWEGFDLRAREFRDFIRAEADWLESYALFRVLMERHGSEQWDTWPEEVRSFASASKWLAAQRSGVRDEIALEVRFYKYVQWLAFMQWRAVRRFAGERGVVLMGDVPFGVNYYSADVWAEPGLFDLRWSGGAPPEPAFVDDEFVRRWGQNWGVPLYCWPQHRATGFAWWRQRVRMIAEAFHLFRIDHVLGFFRIYGFPWRPQRNAEFAHLSEAEARERAGGELPRFHEHPDGSAEEKAANRAQGEEFLRVLQEEVGPGVLIGEDLGTVPDYVRPSLLSLGIPGFKVPFWEREHDTRLTPGADYPRCSVATFATHDHEPLRVTWERWMATIAAAIVEPERLAPARDAAWWEARRLATWAGFEVPRMMTFEEVHAPLLAALLRSQSWLAAVMITDVLGTTQRFNVPGTVGAENWSARLPVGWEKEPAIAQAAALVRASGRATFARQTDTP